MLTFLVAAILLVLLIKFGGQIVHFVILAVLAVVIFVVVGIALAVMVAIKQQGGY